MIQDMALQKMSSKEDFRQSMKNYAAVPIHATPSSFLSIGKGISAKVVCQLIPNSILVLAIYGCQGLFPNDHILTVSCVISIVLPSFWSCERTTFEWLQKALSEQHA